MTSIFQTEDNLNFVMFGIQPYFNPTRSNMEDDLHFLKIEDDFRFILGDIDYFQDKRQSIIGIIY